MLLYLDTSNNLQTIIKLGDQEFITNYSSPRDQDVLGALGQALQQSGESLADLTEINVNTGPGSFTGLRVGLSIANTLSFALNLPLNHQPPGIIVEPNYATPPSITPPKTH